MLIDLVGKTVAGFRLTSRLGEGGMAVVFAAENKLNPQIRRAIKIVLPELASRPEFRRRFSEEANIVEQLQHPNVVRFYGLREEHVDGNELLLMELELLEGDTLAAHLEATPNLGTPELLAWFQGAAEGVAAAHELGIVHRDLKPANLFLTRKGIIKVLDFGIARALDEAERGGRLTRTGTLVGTAAYMAPEVCNGKTPTAAADVYALGISLVEMLLGHHPYAAPGEDLKSATQMMFAHVTQPLPSVRAARPDIEAALEGVIARATAKDPKDRFATARGLADALRAMVGNQPVPVLANTSSTNFALPLPGASSVPAAQSATKFALPLAPVTSPSTPQHSSIESQAPNQPLSRRRSLRTVVLATAGVLVVAVALAFVLARRPAENDLGRATSSKVAGAEQPSPACPEGQAISPDTDGHCCWPGQSWARMRCIGVPTSCPDGLNRDRTVEACVANSCDQGMTLVDSTHCCWQGQAWNSTREECVGIPTGCPTGMVATSDERCEVDPARAAAAAASPPAAAKPPAHHVAGTKVDPAITKREQELRARQLDLDEQRQKAEEQRFAEEEQKRKDEEQKQKAADAAQASERIRQQKLAAQQACESTWQQCDAEARYQEMSCESQCQDEPGDYNDEYHRGCRSDCNRNQQSRMEECNSSRADCNFRAL